MPTSLVLPLTIGSPRVDAWPAPRATLFFGDDP